MTYAYDDWVQFPVKDLYDTQMMAMAINTAKDMYEKGLQLIKDFRKDYGDFMSPFGKDMERYGLMMSNVTGLINDAYANGVDLTRSVEGRALLSRAINSIDPAEYNAMRANAKVGYAYLDAILKARENGTYDENAEAFALREAGMPLFNDFSTSTNGMWNRLGPIKYLDANTMVSPLFEDMLDEYMDSDDQYDYSGVSRDRRALILQANLGALLNTTNGRYHYEMSKAKTAQKLGRTPTESEALAQYQDDLLDASDRFEHRTRTENKDYERRAESQIRKEEDDYRSANDVKVYQKKADIDYEQESKKLMDVDRDNKVSESERKSYAQYGGNVDKNPNILSDSAKQPGISINYDPNDPYKAKVDPVDGRIEFHAESKKGAGDMYYIVPNDVADKVIYRYQDGKFEPMQRGEMNADTHWYTPWADDGSDQVVFVPSGSVITLPDENGNLHQFMFGTINATGEQCMMRIQRRKYNYNK